MNIRAIKRLRARLAANTPVYGMWITLESPSITEMAVALGLDWIVVDAEHGHLDWKEIVGHVRAAVRSETVMLVRVTEDNPTLIKRALDIGADGIVIPHVESAAQLQKIIEMAHYPPRGIRGIGAERATCWGQSFSQHVREADSHTLVIPMIESVKGVKNLPEMISVDGVEIFYFGPADLSATAGFPGQWEGPGIADQIVTGVNHIVKAGKNAGVIVWRKDDLSSRQKEGFRFLGLGGTDAGLLLASLKEMLGAAGKAPRIQTSFEPLDIKCIVEESKQNPLKKLPEIFRPDRRETISHPGLGPQLDLASGIHLDCLVGSHNRAQNLTTGIVVFNPKATLPCHTHRCGESVTILEGELLVEVEGRRYRLTALDNITIPKGLAHKVVNDSATAAKAHVALASPNPDREPAADDFSVVIMAQEETGIPGKEHVVRFKSAKRYAAGPHTEFIDHLNSALIPNIEMSGGYGLFYQGGRLPAHIHDFDESICIIQGRAICNVEGRRYEMSNFDTALQPRGRVHYFINESSEPMVMLWVYAGPLPERILIDETFAAPGADPWGKSQPLP